MYLVLCICIVCLIFGFVVRFRVVVCAGTALVFVVGSLWYDFGGFCGFVVGWRLLLVCELVYMVGGGCLGVMLA